MYYFKEKDVIRVDDREVMVVNPLSSGAQAQVYRVLDPKGAKFLAMKHLFGKYTTDPALFCEKVKVLAKCPAPHPDLVWPLKVSDFDPSTGSFCFLMELVPPDYKPLAMAIKHPRTLTDDQRRELCLKIVDVFEALQNQDPDPRRKLIYSDISEKNILYRIEPDGAVSIKVIDCDNISTNEMNMGLHGTGLFRAPELLRDGAQAKLTVSCDLHALAVAIFRIMVGCHPLDGALVHGHAFTDKNIVRFFGREPVYVFAPSGENPPCDPDSILRLKKLDRTLQIYFSVIFSHECLMGEMERPPIGYLKEALKRC